MSMQYFSIWTQAGLAKKAQAIASGQPLLITHMAIGDTGSNDGSSPPAPNAMQTALRNEQHRQQINESFISPTDQNQTVFSITVLEDVGGFWIKEVGLFADDGTLIAVGSYAPSYKADMASGSPSQIQCNMLLLEASAEVIKVQIDPTTVLASKRYVDEKISTHETATNPHPQYLLLKEAIAYYASVPVTKQQPLIYVEPYGWMRWSSKHNLYQSTADIFSFGDAINPRPGFMYADGSKVLIENYQSLYTKVQDNGLLINLASWTPGMAYFAVNGAYLQLPQLGAQSIRFWDKGRGVDPGRAVFSAQEDAIRNITGSFGNVVTSANTSSGALYRSWNSAPAYAGNQSGSHAEMAIDISRVVPTAHENRVKNTAFPAWIHI